MLDDDASWLGFFAGRRRFDKLVRVTGLHRRTQFCPGRRPRAQPGPALFSPEAAGSRAFEGGASVPNRLLMAEDNDAFDVLGSFCFSRENFSLSSSNPSLSSCPSPSPSPPPLFLAHSFKGAFAPVLRTVAMHQRVFNDAQHSTAEGQTLSAKPRAPPTPRRGQRGS